VVVPSRGAAVVAGLVALEAAGRIGAGIYPCDPGCDGASRAQELHRLFATVGFCSGILGALASGIVFRRRTHIVLAILATVCLLLMTWGNNPVRAEGLWERLATAALSLWLLLLALRMRA
jgi:hypothetical protein